MVLQWSIGIGMIKISAQSFYVANSNLTKQGLIDKGCKALFW